MPGIAAEGGQPPRGLWQTMIALLNNRDRRNHREYLLKRDEQRDQAVTKHFECLPDDVVEYGNEEIDGNRRIWFRKPADFGASTKPKVITLRLGHPIVEVVRDREEPNSSELGR
ncbi:hypothetical protein [Nonomuraea aurantiaca]|uniref:hypothetical protein n=1 Tax=Nonomuraea aurantiaca TaxID=2878562 RepID=UPI001CD91CD1|nr:hypothetical protein [Nonomuraea aurantiaca]MCA2220915.1 hypothetical protein [Nonomuraea aurantiaca]